MDVAVVGVLGIKGVNCCAEGLIQHMLSLPLEFEKKPAFTIYCLINMNIVTIVSSMLALSQLVFSAPAGSLLLPSISLPTNLTEGVGNCATSTRFPNWSSNDWNIHDCWQAVNQLYLKEVWSRPDKEFEFVARGASARMPSLDPQRTPRKYTVGMLTGHYYVVWLKLPGSCVLTVTMLYHFTPRELPNGNYKYEQQSDESTYRKIYNAAKGIERHCTQTRIPGWAQIGKLILKHLGDA